MTKRSMQKQLIDLIMIAPWILPGIVCVGILAALSESIGLSFFIPLLEGAQSPDMSTDFLIPQLTPLYQQYTGQSRQIAILVIIFFAVSFKSVMTYFCEILMAQYKSKVGHHLRKDIFERVLTSPLYSLERYQTGHLINILATDSWRVADAFMVLVNLLINALTVLVFLQVLFLLSWKLTLFTAASLMAISVILFLATKTASKYSQAALDANQYLSDQMCEGIQAVKQIRLYGNEYEVKVRFDKASDRVRRMFFKLDLNSAAIIPLNETLSVLLLIAILSAALLTEQVSFSAGLTFLFILYRLQPRVRKLDEGRLALSTLWAAIKEVSEFIELPASPVQAINTEDAEKIKGSIIFKDISFAYPNSTKSTLENLELVIEQGKTTAIIGPSGAGKTTIINLMTRLYQPQQGEVLINKRAIDSIPAKDWVNKVAVLSQDKIIFRASIRENIAYAFPGATDEDVENAAKLANADEFISALPDGYNTIIGGREPHLSGGQCQRINLARAILRNPDILVLDEPTNSLDNISANLIQSTLKTWGKGKTIVIVAHRLKSIDHADYVVVLDKGKVVQQGSFKALQSSQGSVDNLFQRLFGVPFYDRQNLNSRVQKNPSNNQE